MTRDGAHLCCCCILVHLDRLLPQKPSLGDSRVRLEIRYIGFLYNPLEYYAKAMTDNATEIIFVYTGVGEGASCSKRNVIRIRIDPSV